MAQVLARRGRRLRVAAAAMVVGLSAALGAAADSGSAAMDETRLVTGATVYVDGRAVSTWARLDAQGSPVEAGATVSFAILNDPPDLPGGGPAGAIAVAEFPAAVQATTILNHFALHWEDHGHTPAPFLVPHFDLHFYSVPSAEVARIGSADTMPPAASRLPAGYVYGGPEAFVPEMGGHALSPADMAKPFTAVLILGYYGGKMIFLEPMVTHAVLEAKGDFSFDIPTPAVLDARTLYPARFEGRYDGATNSYQLVFSGFRRIES
jgi:hypothetical protein